MDLLSTKLANRVQEIKDMKPTTKANTRVAEYLGEIEPHIVWDNETYFKDRQVLYMAAHKYTKRHTWKEFEDILAWIKEKNNLHPHAAIKLLGK